MYMLLFLLLCRLSVGDNDLECVYSADSCTLTFFFNEQKSEGEVFYSERCETSVLPWIIAGSLVGLILIIGILALICLKVGFVVWVRT